MDSIVRYLSELTAIIERIDTQTIREIADCLVQAHSRDAQIFVLGNGGSASTASHWACDLGKGTVVPGERRYRIISLTDNNAVITAYANDVSYEDVFVEQLKNLVNPGDVVVGISASGNSENVLRAIRHGNDIGATTIGVTGFGGGKLAKMSDIAFIADSHDYGQVEDLHLILNHILRICLYEALDT